jgi:CheY-like chemotaxis protein
MPAALILNVDDYEAARYAKTRLLQNAGFQVQEAESGADALEAAAHIRPDLILLDVKLPDMDGREVCRQLKTNPVTADLRVVQTSAAFISSQDVERGYASGAEAYLCAPFEPRDLIRLVRSLT